MTADDRDIADQILDWLAETKRALAEICRLAHEMKDGPGDAAEPN